MDKRADIWAFGVVLYELLTGKRLFHGETVSDTLAAVLTKEPDWELVPAKVRRLLKRCLAKEPDKRLRDIGDAWELVDDTTPQATAPSRSRLGWVAVGVLAIIAVIASWIAWRSTRPVDRRLQPLVRLDVDLGPDAVAGQSTSAVISPDGSRLIFPAKSPDGKQVLATRLLNETKPTMLSGTENGRDPFFSPDGKWIGFFADGKMKKTSVQGGAPLVLCDANDGQGADWADNGKIIVALNLPGVLSLVPAEGGTPQSITKRQGLFSHHWPQALPGNEAVLFTLYSGTGYEDASIASVSLKTGEIKILLRGGYFGRYLPTGNAAGYLVYVHEGTLFGAPFDPARLELRGRAVPLLEDLVGAPNSGAGQFSFTGVSSGAGTFVYRTGKALSQTWPVSWLDSSGKTQPLIIPPGLYAAPRFSPDGQQLVLAHVGRGLYVYDLRRDTMSRLRPPEGNSVRYGAPTESISSAGPPSGSAGCALTEPARRSTCWRVRTARLQTPSLPMAGGWRTPSWTPIAALIFGPWRST